MIVDRLTKQTIDDFGDQWTRYTENEGYYASNEMLIDILGPLLPIRHIEGKRVMEIGSGSGRIVNMLLAAGASHVTAVEPSKAMEVLKANTGGVPDRVTYLQCRGDEIPSTPKQEVIISIGVLHHIPDPAPVVNAAREALQPGGKFLAWLYGWEGNGAYLTLVLPIRAVTTRLPHWVLAPLCVLLNALLSVYILSSRIVPLPLHRYMTEVIGRFSYRKRYLVIYDQLKPAYAKYYRRQEAIDLLSKHGFDDVRVHHRHGYSWTVIGTRRR